MRKLKNHESALIVGNDGIEMHVPNLESDANIPPSAKIITAIGILLKEGDPGLQELIQESWLGMIDKMESDDVT